MSTYIPLSENTSVQNELVVLDSLSTRETFTSGYYHIATLLIWKIVPPIIIPLGSIGNLLTIIVIVRHMKKMTSVSLFLLCLAVSDLLVLYTVTLRHWIRHVWQVEIRDFCEVGCKIHVFLTYVSMQLSSWLLVAVTMERVVSVILPHRVKIICTNKIARLVTIMICVLICGLNAHIIYGVHLKPVARLKDYDVLCSPKTGNYEIFFYSIWPWLDFSIVFAIPFIIFICSNIIIISKLASHDKHWRHPQSATLYVVDNDNKRITILLIWLCVFFFLCLTPSSIYFIASPYWKTIILAQENPSTKHNDVEYMGFWYAVINCVSYLNATCNFIFYVLSGSRFRREIINLITCRNPSSEYIFGSSLRRPGSPVPAGSARTLFRGAAIYNGKHRQYSLTDSQMSFYSQPGVTRV